MDMPDYKPNSNKYKKEQEELKEERRVTKVVQGKVKKKSDIRKFADSFISDEAENIGSYIVMDLLIPAIKNTILDIITGSAEMLFGTDRRRRSGRSTVDKVSYVNYNDRYRERDRRSSENVRHSACDFDDIVVNSRGEAEDVFSQLEAMIDTYKVARVSDLYDLVGITGPHTANRYGWTNLRNAEAVRLRDGGYLLKLPRAIPIDN
jgi:hypothetical protein